MNCAPDLLRTLVRRQDSRHNTLTDLGALELSKAIARRRVSAREVVSAFLDRIDAVNPRYNAIVSLRERDDILTEADQKDRQLAKGEAAGWLHGIPIAIKDLVATKGIRTTRGSPIYRDAVPDRDAVHVARLKHSGAIVIGKTNTAEFGLGSNTFNSVLGVTRNALDPAKVAGGSSGGAAVAVATHMIPIADGGDNAGSLRNPAAFNHVYAFRPSPSLLSPDADPRGPPTFDVVGPIAGSVGEVAAMLATLSIDNAWSPAPPGRRAAIDVDLLDAPMIGTRIGWLGDLKGQVAIEGEVLALCQSALAKLTGIDCVVEPVDVDFPMETLWSSYCDLRSWLVSGAIGKHYRNPETREPLNDSAIWEIERGLALSAARIYEAMKIRKQWSARLAKLFGSFDFLALPATQVLPFPLEIKWPREVAGRRMDSYHRWMEIAIPATMGACPVACVPAGARCAESSTGLQLIGPPRNDFACLQLASAYELSCAEPPSPCERYPLQS